MRTTHRDEHRSTHKRQTWKARNWDAWEWSLKTGVREKRIERKEWWGRASKRSDGSPRVSSHVSATERSAVGPYWPPHLTISMWATAVVFMCVLLSSHLEKLRGFMSPQGGVTNNADSRPANIALRKLDIFRVDPGGETIKLVWDCLDFVRSHPVFLLPALLLAPSGELVQSSRRLIHIAEFQFESMWWCVCADESPPLRNTHAYVMWHITHSSKF